MLPTLEKSPTQPKAKRLEVLKILPYINPDADPNSMGSQLASYNLVLHAGAKYREQLTYLETNGVRRYLTGLNEYAPEITIIEDKDTKAAAIKEIRRKVVFLEKMLGANIVDSNLPEKEFWAAIKTVHPTNYSFWDTFFIEPGNEPVFLNPEDPYDLVKISAIEAGGFSTVAKSFEDARMSPNPPKFYLDKATDTSATKVEVKKIKNKALASLTEMYGKNTRKMFYVIKNVDFTNSYQYKNSTSPDIIYDYLDSYISGLGSEKSAKKAAISFNEICALSEEDLRIKAVIADASFYKIISGKGDGLLYHRSTDTMVGKNASEVLSFLKNPLYTKVWESILEEVENYWKD